MADDLLSRIDALASCGWCSANLGESSASGDFCSPEHQRAWAAERSDRLPWRPDAANVLVGNDEASWTPEGGGGGGLYAIHPGLSDRFAPFLEALNRIDPSVLAESGRLAARRREFENAQRLRAELLRQHREAQRRSAEVIARRMAEIDRGVSAWGRQVLESLGPLGAALNRTAEQLGRVGAARREAATRPAPAARMQAALEARRNRNTGPPVPPPGARQGRRR